MISAACTREPLVQHQDGRVERSAVRRHGGHAGRGARDPDRLDIPNLVRELSASLRESGLPLLWFDIADWPLLYVLTSYCLENWAVNSRSPPLSAKTVIFMPVVPISTPSTFIRRTSLSDPPGSRILRGHGGSSYYVPRRSPAEAALHYEDATEPLAGRLGASGAEATAR